MLLDSEKSELVRLARDGDAAGMVEYLRSLAITERFDDLIEAVSVFSEHCVPLADFSKAYLYTQLPGVIMQTCCRTLGRDFVRRFVAWSALPENADWERRLTEAALSGSRFPGDARRLIEIIRRFEPLPM